MRPYDVFISYAHEDTKEVAEPLERALKDLGVIVWIDAHQLHPADRVAERINEGISRSSIGLALVTSNYLRKNWTKTEMFAWMSISAEEPGRFIPILHGVSHDVFKEQFPLVTSIAYIETNNGIDQVAQTVLRALKNHKSSTSPAAILIDEDSVSADVARFISDLQHITINIVHRDPIKPLAALRQIARAGKAQRIGKLGLPNRSVYDHIISLGSTATSLLPHLKTDFRQSNYTRDLALCIVYHDLPEILTGDHPSYNDIPAPVTADQPTFTRQQLLDLEAAASEYILASLINNTAQKAAGDFKNARKLLGRRTDSLYHFFRALDRTDPIIAIWRYIFLLRGFPNITIDEFLDASNDFFTNESPRIATSAKGIDSRLYSLVNCLQDKRLARKYHMDVLHGRRETLTALAERVQLPSDVLIELIEGREMEFVKQPEETGKPNAIRSTFHWEGCE